DGRRGETLRGGLSGHPVQHLRESVDGPRGKLHSHFRPALWRIVELDTARERLDDRDADAERALGLRTDSRADARAVVAHDHLERVRWAPDLDLERPLVASVRVQRDVVARLRRRRADVVDHAWRELEPVGDAAQGLTYERDV